MKHKIEELFKEIEERLATLSDKVKIVNPKHWLCNDTWYVDGLDGDDVSLNNVQGIFSDYKVLSYEDLSDEGMDLYVSKEADRMVKVNARAEHAELKQREARQAKYEELKREFG